MLQSAFDQCRVCITPGANDWNKDACLDCGVITRLECQVSIMINSDACPRPTTAGVPYGPSKTDKCGVCDGMAYNDCMADCTGIYPTDNVQPAGSMAAGQVRTALGCL